MVLLGMCVFKEGEMGQDIHPWAEGWEGRIQTRIRELGHASVIEFLDSHPQMDYRTVSALISTPPIQLIEVQMAEAQSRGFLRRAIMDCLSRNILRKFPDGWSNRGDDPNLSKRVLAFSGWLSDVGRSVQSPDIRPVLESVLAHFVQNPPPDNWVPAGPDDSFLRLVFDTCWPK